MHDKPSRLLVLLLTALLFPTGACNDDKPASHAAVDDLDAAGDDEDTGQDAIDDTDMRPDADEVDGDEVCVLGISGSASPWVCTVPVTETVGCDALALCLCEHHRDAHVEDKTLDPEECKRALTTPRGMITLSDVCGQAGGGFNQVRSLAELAPTLPESGAVFDVLFEGEEVTASAACAEVGAYSLYGEGSSVKATLGPQGEALPQVGVDNHWYASDYGLVAEPFLTDAHVERFHSGTLELALNADGRASVEEALGTPAELLRRSFLVHSDRRALFVGTLASEVMSSTVDGPVVVIEEVAGAGYGTIPIRDGYPSRDPAMLPGDALYALRARFAAARKLVDNTCISTCGCLDGQACREGQCQYVNACERDADCCLGRCADGECAAR